MTQEGQTCPPPIIWAQRKNVLFVTICLEDRKDPILKIEPDQIYFKGVGGTEKKMHEVTMNLYKEIDPSKTVQTAGGRTLELILSKKEEGPYWPRLLKENTKTHWLKSDFNKWVDEDDSEDEGYSNPKTLEQLVQQMTTSKGGPSPKINLDDLSESEGEEEIDSDDELPDLQY